MVGKKLSTKNNNPSSTICERIADISARVWKKLYFSEWPLFLAQVPTAIEEVLEEEAALEAAKENAKKVHQKQEDACSGKICTANEHCCEGQVCVDTDESKLPKLREHY